MGAMITDPLLCNGCTCCQKYLRSKSRDSGLVAIDEACVLCSNMRVSDSAALVGKQKGRTYRLTAGDVEFLSELRS
jgi:hypothetical protein